MRVYQQQGTVYLLTTLIRKAICFTTLAILLSACHIPDEDFTGDPSEYTESDMTQLVIATLASGASATEAAALSTFSTNPSCSYAANRSCSGAFCALNWSNCSPTGTLASLVYSGGWNETFSAQTCHEQNPFPNSCTLSRTTFSTGSVLNFPEKGALTTTTTAHSAYDGTNIGAGFELANSSGTRTYRINGARKVRTGVKGSVWYDASIRSTSDFSITGSRASSNRAVTGGTIELYQNTLGYKMVSRISVSAPLRWTNTGCCFPTEGQIDNTFTGSVEGFSSIQFGPTCGAATYVAVDGTVTDMTLNVCE